MQGALKASDSMRLEPGRILAWEDAPDLDGPTMAELDAEVRRLTEENERLKEQGGTCRLVGYADAPFRAYEAPDKLTAWVDYANIAECSNCGSFVMVPPAFNHIFSTETDEVWPEYRFCPVCRSAVEVEP